MVKKCATCEANIEEEFGKLQGTIIKVIENSKNKFIHVCSTCQKEKDWIEKAKIKAIPVKTKKNLKKKKTVKKKKKSKLDNR